MADRKALLPGLRNFFIDDFGKKVGVPENFSFENVDLQLTNECNFNCIYCSSSSGPVAEDELKLNEIKNFVDICKELNVKSFVMTGGEPLMRRDFFDILYYIKDNGFEISMFTNGSLISNEIANVLYENKVAICLKLDTLNRNTYGDLTETRNQFDSVLETIRVLKDIGYTHDLPLSINSVITLKNIKEIPDLWEWCRKNKITPNCERLLIKGKARDGSLAVKGEILKELHEKIWCIDHNQGIHWDLKIPFFGSMGCVKHYTSLYVSCTGQINMCPGVNISYGNLKTDEFKNVLKTIYSDKNQFRSKIKGKCSMCNESNICYGCRGLAYNCSDDYLESDPMCWFK